MDQELGYTTVRDLCGTHSHIRRSIHFRYDDVSSVTAGAVRAAAKAALKKSDLSRSLDLKLKYDGDSNDTKEEKLLLSRLANCRDGDEMDKAMNELLDFYDRMKARSDHE